MYRNHKNKTGFTLIELSISITIIGLLTAAILVGSSLVTSAESKALLSEVQKLNESVIQFQALYRGTPGDLPDAASYWPGLTNGNGDGIIAAEPRNEPFYAIQELHLAGLLEGSFSGFSGVLGSGFTLATPSIIGNVIGAKSRAGAGIYVKCCSNTDYSRSLNFNNHINIFSVYSADKTKRAGIVTPTEAYFLDKKIDDGIPDTGFVGGGGSYNGAVYSAAGCYSGVSSSSKYDSAIAANKDAKNCQMLFGS